MNQGAGSWREAGQWNAAAGAKARRAHGSGLRLVLPGDSRRDAAATVGYGDDAVINHLAQRCELCAGEALGAALDGGGPAGRKGARRAPHCSSCGTGDFCVPVALPYVFRYLANELAAMGVRLRLSVGEGRG